MLNLFETTFILFLIQNTILKCIWNKLLMRVIGIVVCTMISLQDFYWCIPNSSSASVIIPRESMVLFISIYALLFSQEFASFCLTAQIVLRMWSVLWLKFTWLNAHLYILVHICWNCIYNRCTIQFWLQKNFSSNLELETKWFKVETHAIINSWIGRPNTCHGVFLDTQIIFLNW